MQAHYSAAARNFGKIGLGIACSNFCWNFKEFQRAGLGREDRYVQQRTKYHIRYISPMLVEVGSMYEAGISGGCG